MPNLQKAVKILGPLDALITKYQSDSVPISDVIADFAQLRETYSSLQISKGEKEFILQNINAREQFLVAPVHQLASLLDPRYYGKTLTPAQQKDAEACLLPLLNGDTEQGFKELNHFLCTCRDEEKSYSFQ